MYKNINYYSAKKLFRLDALNTYPEGVHLWKFCKIWKRQKTKNQRKVQKFRMKTIRSWKCCGTVKSWKSLEPV